jgi:hypothetical protein
MSAKKTGSGEKKTKAVTTNSPQQSGKLGRLEGSASDDWNHELANQTLRALWLEHCDDDSMDRKSAAAISALIGICPRDELEGMIAAQLIAAHNGMLSTCHDRRADIRGAAREPKPGE